MKRIIALILACVLCMGLCTAAFAAEPQVYLYNIYQDGMLFRQNTDAIFAGVAQRGLEVGCTLFDAQNEPVAKGMGYVNKSNLFTVSIPAPAGSYAEYTAVLTIDGTEFRRVEHIVFGELWVASGQSNMQMPVGGTIGGQQMLRDGKRGSEWLRILEVPAYPEYKGNSDLIPADAQKDIPGALWFRGDDARIFGTSAVGFFFADQLQKDLDMPVGLLHVSLGGSSIYTWLSRDAIESDAVVKADLQSKNRYLPYDSWKETGHDPYQDMTGNYNKKIAPLRHFRPTGMIWYQGETEIFGKWPYGAYTRAFDLMQKTDSALFGFPEGERMPIVFTQIVSYHYGQNRLQAFNTELADIQQADPATRAMTTIYDVPLSYEAASGSIHPTDKEPVGRRMAYAAGGLVYGKNSDTATAATVRSATVRDGSVYVTLRNVGEGLAMKGNTLHEFSVCGANGVYVGAKAEIVSADTVRVYSETVKEPVSAAYAYGQLNENANLYATDADGLAMPVSVFVTDKTVGTYYWQDKTFADCDRAQMWRLLGDNYMGAYDVWQAQNARLSYTDDAFSGDAALSITAEKDRFSVNPKYTYSRPENATKRYDDRDSDYSHYGKITFAVRNDGETEVKLTGVRFYVLKGVWFTPKNSGMTIPADGQWHEVTLDLSKMQLFGLRFTPFFRSGVLRSLYTFSLRFSGKGAVSVDDFRFTPVQK